MTRRTETKNKIIIIIDKNSHPYTDTETITADIEYKLKYYEPIREYLSKNLKNYTTYAMVEEASQFLSQKYGFPEWIFYNSLCATVRGNYSPNCSLAAEKICASLAANQIHFVK